MKNPLGTELIERVGVVAFAALLSAACGANDAVDPGIDDTEPTIVATGPEVIDETKPMTVATGADGAMFVPKRIPVDMKADVDRSWIESLPSDPAADPIALANAAGLRVHELRAAKLDERVDLGENAVSLITPEGFYRGRIAAETDDSSRDANGTFIQPGGSIEPRGLSGGVDNRTRLTGTSVPGGVGLVATSAGIGSGTMVGWRILRTAAHVVIRDTTSGGVPSPNNGVRLDYRRDGTTIGTRVWSIAYQWGGNYLSKGCATAKDLNGDGDIADAGEASWGYFQNRVACEVEDWALIILPENWWGAAGMEWMGYRMLGSGETGLGIRNGGYAGCAITDAPNPCTPNSFYQDSSTACKVGSFVNGTRLWSNGCDSSRGMSGGTTRQKSPGYFLGHPVTGCTGCSDTFPNRSMGFNQWLYDLQVSLNNQNP